MRPEREPPPLFFWPATTATATAPHVCTIWALDRACFNQLQLPVLARDHNARSGRRIRSLRRRKQGGRQLENVASSLAIPTPRLQQIFHVAVFSSSSRFTHFFLLHSLSTQLQSTGPQGSRGCRRAHLRGGHQACRGSYLRGKELLAKTGRRRNTRFRKRAREETKKRRLAFPCLFSNSKKKTRLLLLLLLLLLLSTPPPFEFRFRCRRPYSPLVVAAPFYGCWTHLSFFFYYSLSR